MKIYVYTFLVVFPVLFHSGCGKTDEDKENEERIIGRYYSNETDAASDSLIYTFNDNEDGMLQYGDNTYDFTWEIKRGKLKIYYDKAPNYKLGNDKYNSRELLMIEEIQDNLLKLKRIYYEGYHQLIELSRL